MFSCSNLRNKKCTIKESAPGEFILNEDKIKVKNTYYSKCSLSSEWFTIIFVLSEEYKKKKFLILERNWLKVKSDDDDEVIVEQVNEESFEIIANSKPSELDEDSTFEARFDGTFDMAKVYFVDDVLLAPSVKKYLDLKNVHTVFLERMATYQKNFDITLVEGEDSLHCLFTINRKLFYKKIREIFKHKTIFEGGPDPLPWAALIKEKKKENLNWEEVGKQFVAIEQAEEEDNSSNWSQNSDEEEEDDDNEFDDCVDEDEVEEEASFEETDEEEEDDNDDFYTGTSKRSFDEDSDVDTQDERDVKRQKYD